jgi:RHS repeat-associated protein
MLADAAGSVVLQRSFDAYGNVRHSTGSANSSLGFAGEWTNPTDGTVYLRARHYQPALGRFLQRDSFPGVPMRPQSLNRYAYAENNPVRFTDPSGHFLDTLLDVGFILYDLYRIVKDNIINGCDNLGENLAALGLDVAGALIPFATGLGAAGRAARHADDILDAAKYADDAADAARGADKASDATKAADNADDAVDYSRPSGYRKGVRDEVWENAKGPDGQVRDPLTNQVMDKNQPWDMGHKPGHEFRKHQQSAEERGISRKEFLDEHNNPNHYRPELPSSNRSHRGEDMTDGYSGP